MATRVATATRGHALALGAVVAVALALAGGWLAGRDTSFVRIRRVQVTGATGPQASAVRGALASAATEMTTLHVRRDRLRAAVRSYPQIRDVVVRTDFPHAARLTVIERPAIAALVVGRMRVPVAADGTVLPDSDPAGDLPTLAAPAIPGSGHLDVGRPAAALALLAMAPHAMRGHVQRLAPTRLGLEAQLRDGPRIVLGDRSRARAKWIAAARVLGDPAAQGARYIDVRVPDRPVAGGSTSG